MEVVEWTAVSRGKKKTSEQPLGKDQLLEIDEWEIN